MPDSCALVDEAAEILSTAVRALLPESLEPDDAARLVTTFTALTKLAESGRALVAPYMEGSGLWRRAGHKSPEAWLAAEAGITHGEAAAIIETGRRLVQAPEVDQAVREGDLSFDQMKEVAEGAEADGDAAGRLLDAARTKTLKQLRGEKRRVKAAAEDDQYGVHERQRRARRGCHGTKPDGMTWLYAEFTPEVGAAVVSHLEAETDRVFREAYREGREESRAAYMSDALARLVTEDGGGTKRRRGRAKGVRAEVIVMVDRAALLRGRVEPGETCEILGQGPIPVEVCHQIMSDAFLRGVLVDGTEVGRVASFGRHITPEQRAALTVEAFLQHGDLVCSADGCDRADIEWDHLHEHAERGPTAIWNLNPLCRGHHKQKTAGRLDLVDGRWRVVEVAGANRAPP